MKWAFGLRLQGLTRQMQQVFSVELGLMSQNRRLSNCELSAGYFIEFRLRRLGVTVPGSLGPENRDRPSRVFTVSFLDRKEVYQKRRPRGRKARKGGGER